MNESHAGRCVPLGILSAGCKVAEGSYFGKNEPPSEQRLIYILNGEPATFDPGKTTGGWEAWIIPAMFEGLTNYHPRTAQADGGPRHTLRSKWRTAPSSLSICAGIRARAARGSPIRKRFGWSTMRASCGKIFREVIGRHPIEYPPAGAMERPSPRMISSIHGGGSSTLQRRPLSLAITCTTSRMRKTLVPGSSPHNHSAFARSTTLPFRSISVRRRHSSWNLHSSRSCASAAPGH